MKHHSLKDLQSCLLVWFEANSRVLPWRLNPTLYGTWISEIMLQQTTVATVIPYWENFMKEFPDVHALAAADEALVLSSWSGLGYYRRARNLHRAARMVVEEYQGELPASRKQWQQLPGVGTYASGAIASIGLGEVVPAIDANARRVLCRWFFDDPVLAGNLKPAEFEKIGLENIHTGKPGQWNEAIMELGATLCRASSTECGKCPVFDHCQAGLAGHPLEIPPAGKSEPVTRVTLATVVVRQGAKILLLPPDHREVVPLSGSWELGRESTEGLHHGFWKIPISPWYLSTESARRALEHSDFLIRWLKNQLGLSNQQIQNCELKMATFSHSITRYRLDIRTWEVLLPEDCIPKPLEPWGAGRFVRLSKEFPISKLVSKSLQRFNSGNV